MRLTAVRATAVLATLACGLVTCGGEPGPRSASRSAAPPTTTGTP